MRRIGFVVVPLLALTACGTTVQGVGSSQLQSDSGLGVPQQSGSTPGAGAPSTSAGDPLPVGTAGPTGVTGPGTTQPGTVGPTSSTSAPLPTTALTANTKPLVVGILNTGSNAALAASFGKTGTSATWQASDEALIRSFNKRGGIVGRQIKTVSYTVEATSTSYTNDLQRACAKFTQDNHVDVVMQTVGTGYFEAFQSCIAKSGAVTIAAFDQGNTDAASFAKYPSLFSAGAPNVDHAIAATLKGLVGTGYLGTKNKIGLVVESCPYNVRAYERTYAPLAKQLGLTVMRRDISCVQGSGDLASFASGVTGTVLPFRSAGVDRVSFISDFESLGVLAFGDQADTQGWKPGYALTSASHVGSNGGQLARGQLPQMVGMGNLPNVDLTSRGTPTGDTLRCRRTLAAEGLSGKAPADYSIMDTACDAFWLLEDGLRLSKGHVAGGALMKGLNAIGTGHRSASLVAGGTSYDALHRDGQPMSAVFAYSTGCSCFRYTSKPTRLT